MYWCGVVCACVRIGQSVFLPAFVSGEDRGDGEGRRGESGHYRRIAIAVSELPWHSNGRGDYLPFSFL